MKAKWLNGYNEETKQTEQFYPITHANAVIDLIQNDLMDTEPADLVGEDGVTILSAIEGRFTALEQRVTNVENELDEAVTRLSLI